MLGNHVWYWLDGHKGGVLEERTVCWRCHKILDS